MEGIPDILQILEKVQVIFFDIRIIPILGKKLKKLLVYSQASVTNRSVLPTRMLPPMLFNIPPMDRVGSVPACSRISVTMEVVVVLP